MLEQLTSPEVTELLSFDAVEPFGEYRADLRMGILAQTMLRPHLKSGARMPAPLDFMPFEHHEPKVEDPQTLGERLLNFFKGIKHGRT